MKTRDIIFNKYGGRCSYCGDELKKGWHIDHAEPVERFSRTINGGYFHKETGERLTEKHLNEGQLSAMKSFEYKPSRQVHGGFSKPENHNIENMMPSCASCNINKHSMSIEEFRHFIEGFVKSLNNNSTQYKIAKRYKLIQETGIGVKFYFESVSPLTVV